MSTYLYGVVRRPGGGSRLSVDSLGTGVGSPPKAVRLVELHDLAAVVSTVAPDEVGEEAGARALRRDMTAHADVLGRVLDARTVLPSRFGIVLPDDRALIDRLLAPQHDVLLDA